MQNLSALVVTATMAWSQRPMSIIPTSVQVSVWSSQRRISAVQWSEISPGLLAALTFTVATSRDVETAGQAGGPQTHSSVRKGGGGGPAGGARAQKLGGGEVA